MTEDQQEAGQSPQMEEDRGYTPPEVGDSNLAQFLRDNKIDLTRVQSGETKERTPEEERVLGIVKAVSCVCSQLTQLNRESRLTHLRWQTCRS